MKAIITESGFTNIDFVVFGTGKTEEAAWRDAIGKGDRPNDWRCISITDEILRKGRERNPINPFLLTADFD